MMPVQSIDKYIYLKVTITNVVTTRALSRMGACLKRSEGPLRSLSLSALLIDRVVDGIAVVWLRNAQPKSVPRASTKMYSTASLTRRRTHHLIRAAARSSTQMRAKVYCVAWKTYIWAHDPSPHLFSAYLPDMRVSICVARQIGVAVAMAYVI
jgi:hypothetical protein